MCVLVHMSEQSNGFELCLNHFHVLYFTCTLLCSELLNLRSKMLKLDGLSFQVLLLIAISMANDTIEAIVLGQKQQIGYSNQNNVD